MRQTGCLLWVEISNEAERITCEKVGCKYPVGLSAGNSCPSYGNEAGRSEAWR